MRESNISNNFNFYIKKKSYFYSHIKGLGINDLKSFRYAAQGFVAQEETRKSLGLIIEMVNFQNLENQGIMITGLNGVGKTSLAFGISCSVSNEIPFVKINAAEMNSSFVSTLEIINQAIRKSIGISFYQESIIIKGEVVCIQIFFSAKKREKISNAKLILKTNQIQSVYEIGPNILKNIENKKIDKGDIITLNKISGEIQHFKKSTSENIIQSYPTFPRTIPLGSLEKHNIIEYFLTLHELDLLNSSDKIIAKIFSDFEIEIPVYIRNKIDKIIINWEKNLKAKVIKGIFFFDDLDLLDQNSFVFLSKVMEIYLSPFFFFTSGCLKANIKKTSFISHYAAPADFLDRLVLIPMHPLSRKEILNIIVLKIQEKMIKLKKNAFNLIIKIGYECGILYLINLLSPLSIFINDNHKKIELFDIKKCYNFFSDSKRFIRHSNVPKYFVFKNGKFIGV
jgi:RuvB-like protein 2